MDMLREILSFYDVVDDLELKAPSISLWHAVMHRCNRGGWKDWTVITSSKLEALSGQGKTAVWSNLKTLKKNFARIYGTMVLYLLTVIAVNIFFGLFTLGVGLFVTIPLTFYFMTVLNSTLYYQNNNLRYYIDKNTIIN